MRKHTRSILPTVRHLLWRQREPSGSKDWRGEVVDPQRGPMELCGRYHDYPGARSLVLIIHGLGGSHKSFYTYRAARAAAAAGMSSLRLSLRGAFGDAPDFYHAGLVDDGIAALEAPEFAHFDQVFILGYSMGGNQTLRIAAQAPPQRLGAVAAACPPIDLGACGRHLDENGMKLYRRWILRGLKQHYRAVEAQAEVPTPSNYLKSVDTFRIWDGLTVVPRFGFPDVDRYYLQSSAARCLDLIEIPALIAFTEDDPIVNAESCRSALAAASSSTDIHWLPRGGHLGFRSNVDLGYGKKLGFEEQVMAFFQQAASMNPSPGR